MSSTLFLHTLNDYVFPFGTIEVYNLVNISMVDQDKMVLEFSILSFPDSELFVSILSGFVFEPAS